VRGWNDPRMPTISGMRRRGYPAEAIREFCSRVGISRAAGTVVDFSMLEFCVRESLNRSSPRVMAVLDPVRVIIENYPQGRVEWFAMPFFPEEAGGAPEGYAGELARKVPFAREIYIERDDFREEAPKKFFRLSPGQEVRLRYAYYITCTGIDKDADGNIVAIRCLYDPASRGGGTPDGRKVKGALHWVEASHAVDAEVRLYDSLFIRDNPMALQAGASLPDAVNPESLRVVRARLEPALAGCSTGDMVQFERIGYFRMDEDSSPGALVFNRTATLKDSWAKLEKQARSLAEPLTTR